MIESCKNPNQDIGSSPTALDMIGGSCAVLDHNSTG